jgi:hypothetical protein
MYGLNAVAFVFFCGINLLAYRLSKASGDVGGRAMRGICLALLLGNVLRYTLAYPLVFHEFRIPVEFSTVAYFAVPAILLTGRAKARSWAAYSGLMAGFFYYIGMIAAGGPIYNSYAPYDIYIAMFCHGALYICGLVTVSTRECAAADRWQLAAGVGYVGLRAALLRPLVGGSGQMLIYILLDGTYVRKYVAAAYLSAALPVYYVVLTALIWLSIRGFFRLSQNRYRMFAVQA